MIKNQAPRKPRRRRPPVRVDRQPSIRLPWPSVHGFRDANFDFAIVEAFCHSSSTDASHEHDLGRPMSLTGCGERTNSDGLPRGSMYFKLGRRLLLQLNFILSVAVGTGCLVAAAPAGAASLDERVEIYRGYLVRDVDRILTSARVMRASMVAKDLPAAKQAWIDARIGGERVGGFDYRPRTRQKNRCVAKSRRRISRHRGKAVRRRSNPMLSQQADALLLNLSELSLAARMIELTPLGLLNGIVRLAYECGESKIDGGELRVSGTSLFDMRNNVDGIELAYRTRSLPPRSRPGTRPLPRGCNMGSNESKALVDQSDLRVIAPDRLAVASDRRACRDAAKRSPRTGLKTPTLEDDAR